MHIFKIELSENDYWLLRRSFQNAEAVQQHLQSVIDQALRYRRALLNAPTSLQGGAESPYSN